MDQLIGQLLDKGITTTIAVVFLYFCWHVITRTLPEQRAEFLGALKDHGDRSSDERRELAERHERVSERLAASVDGLSTEVRALRAERVEGDDDAAEVRRLRAERRQGGGKS